MNNSYKNTLLSLFLLFIFVHTSACGEDNTKKKIKAKPANLSSNINNEKPETLSSNINNEIKQDQNNQQKKQTNQQPQQTNQQPQQNNQQKKQTNQQPQQNNQQKKQTNQQPQQANQQKKQANQQKKQANQQPQQTNQQPQQTNQQPQQTNQQPQQTNQQPQQNNQQSQQNNQQSQQNNQKMTEKELNDRLKNIVCYQDDSGVTYINNYIDDFISNLKNIEDKFIIEELYKAKEDEYNNSNNQNINKYNHIATYNTNYKKHLINLSKFLTEDLRLLQKEKLLDIYSQQSKCDILGLLDNLAQDTKNNSKTLNLDETQRCKIFNLKLELHKNVTAKAIKYISSIEIDPSLWTSMSNKIHKKPNNLSKKHRKSIQATIDNIIHENNQAIKNYDRAMRLLQ